MKIISLSRGMVTVVDDEDYDYLMQWSWHAMRSRNRFYAAGSESYPDGTISHFLMHRIIMRAAPGEFIDHANRDSLNNQRFNLRRCTTAQNLMNGGLCGHNTSGYKGVSKTRQGDKWRATIGLDGSSKQLGVFETAEDAARVYDAAAKHHFGEFARTNLSLGLLPSTEATQCPKAL